MDDKHLIEALGGVTSVARRLGEPNSTVHSWKQKGRIPRWRRPSVLAIAREEGIELEGPPASGKSAAA